MSSQYNFTFSYNNELHTMFEEASLYRIQENQYLKAYICKKYPEIPTVGVLELALLGKAPGFASYKMTINNPILLLDIAIGPTKYQLKFEKEAISNDELISRLEDQVKKLRIDNSKLKKDLSEATADNRREITDLKAKLDAMEAKFKLEITNCKTREKNLCNAAKNEAIEKVLKEVSAINTEHNNQIEKIKAKTFYVGIEPFKKTEINKGYFFKVIDFSYLKLSKPPIVFTSLKGGSYVGLFSGTVTVCWITNMAFALALFSDFALKIDNVEFWEIQYLLVFQE